MTQCNSGLVDLTASPRRTTLPHAVTLTRLNEGAPPLTLGTLLRLLVLMADRDPLLKALRVQ
eukprot:CAMPEP_0118948186 /NCGR_PEP_ID=MMETSP1169-20130426/47389_1 /TAXON_ID=36882 /ORGANISM="Pyramimonas obovata, Strain CCMP722" /LENGTH=61 /DNA_ID=CAMNT_0006894559 /DNA_START=132 /DNA_END=314 /DNA_ORIENTATION=+